MEKNQERNALRASHVIEAMRIGERYSMKDFTKKLSRTESTINRVLQPMEADGAIEVIFEGRSKFYILPKDEEVAAQTAPGRYVPEWKAMGIHDLATFQRQCEAARNPDKGVV